MQKAAFFRRPIRPISFSHYSLIFTGICIISFSLYAVLTTIKMNELQQEVSKADQNAASAELSSTISKIVDEIYIKGTQLTAQANIQQSLAQPARYPIWENSNPLKNGTLPRHVKAIKLYNSKGIAFADIEPTPLPDKINPEQIGPHITSNSPLAELNVIIPIKKLQESTQITGYLGIRSDLLLAIHQRGLFELLDAHSLRFSIGQGQQVPLNKVHEIAAFKLRQSPEMNAVQSTALVILIQLAIVITFICAAFYLLGQLLLGRPLKQLAEHTDNLRHTPDRAFMQLSPFTLPVTELDKVWNSLNEFQGHLLEAKNTLDAKEQEMMELERIDPLTGSCNRNAFDQDWTNICNMTAGRRLSVSFMLFDCNHFKTINESYGHHAGDGVIKGIAASLIKTLRDGDKLYRLGSDEFAAILLNCPAEPAVNVAKRCHEQLNKFDFTALGIKEPVKISIGVAHADGTDTADLNDLRIQADIAMHFAKSPNNGNTALYNEGMASTTKALFSSWTTSAVFEAVTSGEGVEIHYQPIVNLHSSNTQYYEALIRIRNDNTLILPFQIFPIVEARQLEVELDFAIFDRILVDLKEGKLPRDTGVSINVSAPSIIRPEVIEKLSLLLPYMSNYKFVLEVTETAMITRLQQATEHLSLLRDKGFVVALDDFGSGYSSLRYLANMPVDLVKFDISMVRCLEGDPQKRMIVENLARMISEAGYQMVAEGIENQELVQRVKDLGFQYGQGYFFGRPAPLAKQTKVGRRA